MSSSSVPLRIGGLLLLLALITLAGAQRLFAHEGSDRGDLLRLRRQIKQLQTDQAAQRRRMDESERLVEELEAQLRWRRGR